MARHRTIDETTILDAAERVIVENGAANLTLDAVANEAGISKGSVVRDYGSKKDLIRAIVGRRFGEYQSMLDEAADKQAHQGPQARIAAHMELAEVVLPEEQRLAANQLCSALANDKHLVEIVASHYRREIDAIRAPGAAPDAILAFLAVEGLKSLEFFGGHRWPEGERQELLKRIAALAEARAPVMSD